MPHVAEHIAKSLDHRALARSRDACDANAQGLPRMGKEILQHPLRLREMTRAVAFDERDGAREDHAIPRGHAFHIVFHIKNHAIPSETRLSKIRVDVADRQVLDAVNAAHDARGKILVRVLRHPVRLRVRVFRHGRYPAAISSFARPIKSFKSLTPASGMFVPGAKMATAPLL